MSLLVVGTVAFDALETPFAKVDKITGGSGNYICHAASQFVDSINLVSIIGDDFNQTELDWLKGKGVNLEGVEVKQGKKSFFWSGRYHLDMNTRDTLDTQLNVLLEFNPVLPMSYRTPDFVLLGNIDPHLQIKVIEQLESRPKLVAMDTMNFWMDQTPEALDRVLKMVDLLIVNDEEARQLSGQSSLVKAARTIREKGPKYLIIKKGEHGALLFFEEKVFVAPALPLEEVFDPTGAGDSFAGGFIGFLARAGAISYDSMKQAVIYGSAMASFCVEKFGPQRLKEIGMEDVRERVKIFVELVDFDIELRS